MERLGECETLGHEHQDQAIVDLLAEAERAFQAGELMEARAVCLGVLAQDATNHKARVTISLIQAKSGEMDLARESLEKALEDYPTCPVSLNWYASMLREQKEYGKAIDVCKRILEITPRDAESHNNLGLTFLAAGRYEEAIRSFIEAERLDGAQISYVQNSAIAHKRRKSDLEAEATFRKGLVKWPTDPLLNAGLGEVLFERGELEAAIPYFRVAVAGDDKSLNYKIALAQALALTSRFDEAEELARQIVAVNDNHAQAHAVIGSILQHRGNFEGSADHLRKAVTLDPGLAGAYFELVYGGKFKEDDRAMLGVIEKLIHATGLSSMDTMLLNYALGKGYDDLSEYAQAIGFFEEANRLAIAANKKVQDFRIDPLKNLVDKNLARFDSNFFVSHRERGLEQNTPIFVVGMMRSGSTLTEQILSSHPSIGAGGELMFWPERADDLDMGKLGFNFEKAQAHAQDYLELLAKLAPGSTRVTDKMTDNILLLGMLTTLFPNARFICCRRHPVGHCLSLYMTPFRYSQPYLHDKEHIAAAYTQYARMMDHWKQVVPADRYMEVWYRDVVEDRERVAREMIEFCGLEWSDSCLHHEKNERIVVTASKWQARQPIYKSSTERWLHYKPWIKPFTDLVDDFEELAA